MHIHLLALSVLLLAGCAVPLDEDGPQTAATPLTVPDQTVYTCRDWHPTLRWVYDMQPLLATGGTPTEGYTWSVEDVEGLDVDEATGMVVRIDPEMAASSFQVTVRDGFREAKGEVLVDHVRSDSDSFGQASECRFSGGFQVPPQAVPNGTQGAPYAHRLLATHKVLGHEDAGALMPWKWNATGLEAACLAMDEATGVVSGVPCVAPGTKIDFALELRDAKDGLAWCSDGCRFTIHVEADPGAAS